MVSQVNRPILVSLPMTGNLVNDVSVAPSIPTETPRLLKEWRASFTPALSQVKAAEKLGIPLRNLTRWEKGQHYPVQASIEHIAPQMGLEVEDFYAIEENPSEVTRERLIRIEQMLEALTTALLTPSQQKRLTAAQEKALAPFPEDAVASSPKRRSRAHGASSGRRRATG